MATKTTLIRKSGRIVLPTLEGQPEISAHDARILLRGVVEPRKQAYILALAQLGSRSRAARAVGCTRVTAWEWQRDDAAFNAAYIRAMEIASDLMEDEMVRRAAEGVLEPVFHAGMLVGSVRKYSDTLLIFFLKGAKPEKYADRQNVQHSGEVDVVSRLNSGRQRALQRAQRRITSGEI